MVVSFFGLYFKTSKSTVTFFCLLHYSNFTETKIRSEEQISTIMNQTIINTSGDGNVVNTGEKARISAKINITKGNKDELIKYLKDYGISEEDTSELATIIDTEQPDASKMTFGEKVNAWIQKMLGKALDGTWSIGLGAAGNLLAEAIKLYYGI